MYGQQWTAERVADALIQAFRTFPDAPIYSPRLNVFRSPRPIVGADLIAVTAEILGRESRDRKMLLMWARAKAWRFGPRASMRSICREQDWSWTTFHRRRKRTCRTVAEELNKRLQVVPAAAQVASSPRELGMARAANDTSAHAGADRPSDHGYRGRPRLGVSRRTAETT